MDDEDARGARLVSSEGHPTTSGSSPSARAAGDRTDGGKSMSESIAHLARRFSHVSLGREARRLVRTVKTRLAFSDPKSPMATAVDDTIASCAPRALASVEESSMWVEDEGLKGFVPRCTSTAGKTGPRKRTKRRVLTHAARRATVGNPRPFRRYADATSQTCEIDFSSLEGFQHRLDSDHLGQGYKGSSQSLCSDPEIELRRLQFDGRTEESARDYDCARDKFLCRNALSVNDMENELVADVLLEEFRNMSANREHGANHGGSAELAAISEHGAQGRASELNLQVLSGSVPAHQSDISAKAIDNGPKSTTGVSPERSGGEEVDDSLFEFMDEVCPARDGKDLSITGPEQAPRGDYVLVTHTAQVHLPDSNRASDSECGGPMQAGLSPRAISEPQGVGPGDGHPALVHSHGANDVDAQPLFLGMVNETRQPGEEQAQTAPPGSVSASVEDLQTEPSEAGAQQPYESPRGEEGRAADDGENPSSVKDQMVLELLKKQAHAIDTILTNQDSLRAQLNRADGQIEQLQVRLQMRQDEGKGRENRALASQLAGYGGSSQGQQDARAGYHPGNPSLVARQDHRNDDREHNARFSVAPSWSADPHSVNARERRLQRESIVPTDLMHVPAQCRSTVPLPKITVAGRPLAAAMELFTGTGDVTFAQWMLTLNDKQAIHNWSDDEVAVVIRELVRDRAYEAIAHLCGDKRGFNKQALLQALYNEFCGRVTAQEARTTLHGLRQGENEGYYEFSQRVRELCFTAWTSEEPGFCAQRVLEQFELGVRDVALQRYFLQNCPGTIQEAVQMARAHAAMGKLSTDNSLYPAQEAQEEIDSSDEETHATLAAQKAERKVSKARKPRTSTSAGAAKADLANEIKGLKELMAQQCELLTKLSFTSTKRVSKTTCFRCGKEGHWANKCPERASTDGRGKPKEKTKSSLN